MRIFWRSALAFIALMACAAAQCDALSERPAPKPAAPEAPLQMMTYQMVLFKQGPQREAKPGDAKADISASRNAHLGNLARLNRERIAVVYGPFTGEEKSAPSLQGLQGIAILDVPDAAAAKKQFQSDPFVQAGEMVLEVKPWLGPKGWFKPPKQPAGDTPEKMDVEPLVFGVLVRGPAAKAEPPVHTMEQRQEIQKGHLAYMDALNKQGKLVAAGPFMVDGEWRGVVVYRVSSVAEAQQLAAGDPAVKAGRLALEARPWMTLKGILQ
jgi:uncharacterized protein YciI